MSVPGLFLSGGRLAPHLIWASGKSSKWRKANCPACSANWGRTKCPLWEEGGSRGELQALPRQMLAWLFPRAAFREQADWRAVLGPQCGSGEHPDRGRARVSGESPFGKFWGSASPAEAPHIRGKGAQRSRGSQQLHGPQCALHIPSTAQYPEGHLFMSPQWWDRFCAWVLPCLGTLSQPGTWRGAECCGAASPVPAWGWVTPHIPTHGG